MQVWLVESGAYEDHYIELVATSIDAGTAALKSSYGQPYVVAWEDPQEQFIGGQSCGFRLVGHFEEVEGYSIKYDAYFYLRPHDVIGAAKASVQEDQESHPTAAPTQGPTLNTVEVGGSQVGIAVS